VPENQVTLTKDEIGVLGRVLRGESVRGPVRAGTRLVKRRLCLWMEPDGVLGFTPAGRAAAIELWPGVSPAHPELAVAAEGLPTVSAQIALLPESDPLGHRTPLADSLSRTLGGGVQGDTLAEVIVEHYPQGRGLSTASRRALQTLGCTYSQAQRVVDAFALVRACHRGADGARIDTAGQMAREIYDSQAVGSLEVECFWVVALDAGRKLVSITSIARGGLSKVDIVMREVFTPLLRARAAAAYIAHNHPSGDPRWSDSDVRLTQRVTALGESLGIEIVDHLVLAPSGAFVSMAEEDVL
jgi:DNA repair protein RadC